MKSFVRKIEGEVFDRVITYGLSRAANVPPWERERVLRNHVKAWVCAFLRWPSGYDPWDRVSVELLSDTVGNPRGVLVRHG
jgi:hypothetical protein